MAICGIAPMAMTLFFIFKIKYYRSELFIKRFGSIIKDLNFRSRFNSIYISTFCYRRLAEVVLIVFMAGYPYA
jgi:hypothetical protein